MGVNINFTSATKVVPLLLLLLCSCRTIEPVVQHQTDTLYVSQVMRDSIYVHDSVRVVEKGDTVTSYVYRYVYRDRYVCDTVYESHTDTVTVSVDVPAELTAWQRFRMSAGTVALVVAGVLLVILFAKLFGLRL